MYKRQAEALKTAECNACMKRIVAAPTAGSCGVLPAVLLPGTCCHWKSNFGAVIPLLADSFRVLCVSYDGFDETEPVSYTHLDVYKRQTMTRWRMQS